MNRGAPSSQPRDSGPPTFVSRRQGSGKLSALQGRFERLIERSRLLGQHCDRAPEGLKQALKQFLELAVLELEEGYQTLVKFQDRVPSSDDSADALNDRVCHEKADDSSRVELEREDEVTLPKVVADPPICEQRSNSVLDQTELSFDAMAKLAEIPEAADLTAILARLNSGSDANDANDTDDIEITIATSPSNARERLLGFEVCRMEASSTPNGSSPVPVPKSHLADMLSMLPQPAEQAEVVAAPGIDQTSADVPESDQFADALTGAMGASLEPGVVACDSAEVAAAESNDPAGDSASERSDSVASPQEEQTGSPSAAKGRAQEPVENTNPLDSIAAENLQAILSLKEELEQVSARFKKSAEV